MADEHMLLGKNFIPPDIHGKVTGKAKYAEDFRAEGMAFCRLMLSPMPHAKVRNIDAKEALAMPGVFGILTADDVPAQPPPERSDPHQRADVRRPADPRGRGRRRDDRARRDRQDQARSRGAAVHGRPAREPVPGRPRRAPRRQRDRQPLDRPAAAQEGEVDARPRSRARRKGSCRPASPSSSGRTATSTRASRKPRSCSTRRS